MMRLFNVEDYEVKVEPEALELTAFREIYKRDKTRGKFLAKQELAYVYFMEDPRSDYMYLTEEKDRSEAVRKGLGLNKTWREDIVVRRAREFYRGFRPVSAGLLDDTRYFIAKFRERLREMSDNIGELDVKELKEVFAMMKQIPALTEELDKAEKALNKDLAEEDKARGSKDKSVFEDED